MRLRANQNCNQCGKHFVAVGKKTRKYCSLRCWYQWRTDNGDRARRPCVVCGSPTRKDKSIKTCSYQCFRKLRTKERPCLKCGTLFTVPLSHQRKYCTHKCSTEHNKVLDQSKKCLNCGTEFRFVSNREIKQRRFCSQPCARRYLVGQNNPLWRGNRSAERGPNWKGQQELARQRDSYNCQCCGTASTRQKVSVDHIVPYRLAKKYASDALYDPNSLFNLISLCRSCHGKKTCAESTILRGDVLGFISAVKPIIPLERLISALRYSQLPVPPIYLLPSCGSNNEVER